MALSEKQLEAVQLVVLDRWNPKLVNDKIAKTVGVEKSTVFRWRKDPEFDAELQKQLERDRQGRGLVPGAPGHQRGPEQDQVPRGHAGAVQDVSHVRRGHQLHQEKGHPEK